MKKFALIAALVLVLFALAAPRAQAQTTPTNATTNGQLATSNTANALGFATTPTTNGQQLTGPRGGTTTGIICIEEMTATFCNVATGPNTNGYGSSGGSAASAAAGTGAGSASAAGSAAGGGGSAATSSIPACSSFPPPNELCN